MTATTVTTPAAAADRPAPEAILHATETGAALPRAIIVTGTFAGVDGVVDMVRSLRSAGATEDVIGLAVPLSGDPATEDGWRPRAAERKKQGFGIGRFLLTVLDPHQPGPDLTTLQKGRNSILAQAILGDISRWLVGVRTFRVPGAAEADPGIWILGRPNHAAAVAGQDGAATGGTRGTLLSLGIPAALVDEAGARLAAGECLFTTCETDHGRVNRDLHLLKKCGARTVFEPAPVLSPSRRQT